MLIDSGTNTRIVYKTITKTKIVKKECKSLLQEAVTYKECTPMLEARGADKELVRQYCNILKITESRMKDINGKLEHGFKNKLTNTKSDGKRDELCKKKAYETNLSLANYRNMLTISEIITDENIGDWLEGAIDNAAKASDVKITSVAQSVKWYGNCLTM